MKVPLDKKFSVSNLSPDPSVLITPIKNFPLCNFVNAIKSPLGDHTGVP